MILSAYILSLRSFCTFDTSSLAFVAVRSASAWASCCWTSRGSSWINNWPFVTRDPVSTVISVICPEDFDFTSMTLIGSTCPEAVASDTMVRRETAAVSIGSGCSFSRRQA